MWLRFWVIGLATMGSAAFAVAETILVRVDKLTFAPAAVSAHVGDTIEWVNADLVAHTATTRTTQWDVVIPAEGMAHVTLKSAGVFEYYCRFHPNMAAQITVVD
jgi:plastocyanin